MAALSITHTGKSASDAAQALSDVATRGSDAATTAERTIVDVASIIIMISALLSFKLAVYSYVNQVPEAVDTLLQIKEFLAGQQGDAIARRYLQEYKKYIFTFVMMKKALLTSFIFRIQEDVHRIARPMANTYRAFSVERVWSRFRESRQANKEAHRLLEDVKVSQTNRSLCCRANKPSYSFWLR